MENDKNIATEPKQPKKWLALITYAVVVACLLLGFLLPLSNVAGMGVENMLCMQLPGALGSLLGMPELGAAGAPFTYDYPFNFMGLLGEAAFDIGALFVLLYALVTLGALIGLIPVIASKKTSKTAMKTASVIEVCALVVLSVLMFMQLLIYCIGGELVEFSYSILVAFGGTLICLIIQTFADKKGSGAIKFVSLLLSGIAVFFIIYPVIAFIPQTAALDFFVNGLYGVEGSVEGITFAGAGGGILSLLYLFSTVFPLAGSAAVQTITVITLIAALLVLLNFILDIMGLGKKTNSFMLLCNLVRFSLEVAAVAIMLIVTFFIEGVTAGILLYVLLGIAVIQLVISVIRYVMMAKAKKAANPAKKEENAPKTAKASRAAVAGGTAASSHEQQRAERRAQREAELAARAAKEAEEAQPTAEEEAPAQEPLYDGPVDEFIKKLTNYERKEFYAVFLERSRGNLPNIPDYIVGGNNNKFFSTVFIYFGRVRALVSDGLLNKLYEQAHVMD